MSSSTAASDVGNGRFSAAEQPSQERTTEQTSWAASSPSARQQVLEETAGWLRVELPTIFQTGVRHVK